MDIPVSFTDAELMGVYAAMESFLPEVRRMIGERFGIFFWWIIESSSGDSSLVPFPATDCHLRQGIAPASTRWRAQLISKARTSAVRINAISLTWRHADEVLEGSGT